MIFEEIAQVMDARPVKEIQRRTGLKKNRVYSLRTGCCLRLDYDLVFALDRLGYDLALVPLRQGVDGKL